jgi:hypothetical protein
LRVRQCSGRFGRFQIPLSFAVGIDLDQSMSIRRLEGRFASLLPNIGRRFNWLDGAIHRGEFSAAQGPQPLSTEVGIFRAYDGFDFSIMFSATVQRLSDRSSL